MRNAECGNSGLLYQRNNAASRTDFEHSNLGIIMKSLLKFLFWSNSLHPRPYLMQRSYSYNYNFVTVSAKYLLCYTKECIGNLPECIDNLLECIGISSRGWQDAFIVPMLRVGMQPWTLCVPIGMDDFCSKDAERPR